MHIQQDHLISLPEVNRDFSRAAEIAETFGKAIIMQDDKPKYMLIDMDSTTFFDLTEGEKIDIAARRVLERYRPAFEELAKR